MTWITGIAKPPVIPLMQAFDGRYNDSKGISISIIEQPDNYFYSIYVKNNSSIISQLIEWVKETEKLADSKVNDIYNGNYSILLNITGNKNKDKDSAISVGVDYPADKSKIDIFLQSSKPIAGR